MKNGFLQQATLLLKRLPGFLRHVLLHPEVHVTAASPNVVRFRNLEAPTRDGTILRLDAYRPKGDSSPRPVILSAHPYGKDNLPERKAGIWKICSQYRMFRMPAPVHFSSFTGWEAPDPVCWVNAGYVVVNLDLRGAGQSDGLWNPLTVQEGEDVYDVIEWIAQQPWCDGHIGMLGVSYLAISQYQAAALNPPHLKAICPWEGFSDVYRDFARPGGILENGFLKLWSSLNAKMSRTEVDLFALFSAHQLDDETYKIRRAALEEIRAPMLVCGSFSDHCLHSRGSLEAFRRVGSPQKWLWTHRGGKWSSFYSAEAFSDQLAFFDYFLKGANNGWASRPAVRLCTADGEAPGQERIEHLESFPPVDVKPTSYWLTAQGQLSQQAPGSSATLSWPEAQSNISWTISFAQTVTFSGPMELMLNLKVDAEDLDLFVAVGKWRNGRRVGYEGSFGFDQDFITHGQLRLSQREIDPERSAPCAPVLRHQQHLPIKQGELLQVRIPLLSSSTRFHPGEMLKLQLHRRWFFPRQPVSGQFPASYEQFNKPCTVTIQTGGQNSSALICPQRSC